MPSSSWSQIIIEELDEEVTATRAMLEALPQEHLEWKPHDKSWALSHLTGHMANLLKWQCFVLEFDDFDLATVPAPDTESVGNAAETLKTFDDNFANLRRGLEDYPDSKLEAEWTLRHGDHVILARPRHAVIRTTGIRHLVHHRGQLSVYLRLLNVPVPSTYGPTADQD